MSIVVGTLTIDLAANTASFAQSMDKMTQLSAKSANDIKRSLEKIAAAGAAMAAAIATGTVGLIKSAIDSADELGKMAQSAGTSSETLSTLGYAARLSGLQMDQLGGGLVKLSKAAFLAQNGNVQLERIFGRLGVSVTDSNGHLKDSGVLLGQVATKFAGTADGAGKTAVALALFGKSGAALIPFLNQYGEKQAEVNEEAHRFGLVLSLSTVQAAAAAQEKLKKLSSIVEGVGYSLLGATLPALDKLGDKLIQIASDANIPDLAKAFGEKVSSAVTILGNALDFAAKHAQALKTALEALAAVQLGKIAIPIIGDLAGGGMEKAGAGISKLLLGFAGLTRVVPVLAQFGGWLKYTASFVGLLASEEGIASAASYVLGGAMAAIGGPIGVAIAAIAGIGIAIYKFRDTTFSLQGSTYELRDIWNAAWIVMKNTVGGVVDWFKGAMQQIKDAWTGVVNWIRSNPIGNYIGNDLVDANTRLNGYFSSILGKLTPQFAINALNQAKAQREGAASIRRFLPTMGPVQYGDGSPKKPPLDTAGLGKPQKDIFGDEVRKLDLATAQQKAYLAVLDGTPEQIDAVAAAEKARAAILELNNRLTDEGRAKLTAHQEALIQQKVAAGESLKALNDYGKELVSQQHGADLSIQQTRAMAAANLQGDAAIRRTTVDNAILGLTFNRTAEQIRTMTPELAKLRGLLTAKASVDLVAGTDKEIRGLRDELVQRQLVNAAALESVEVQRQAALASKLYPLNRDIKAQPAATADDRAALATLLAKRDALIAVTKAEWDASDAQAALALLSPAEQYEREMESLNRAEEALRTLQAGTLSYGQELGIAARQQDAFNKATEDTITLLVREGSMGDGVKAFFLKMQEEAKTAASQIYDVLTETFNKLSTNLTDLITAPNSQKRKEAINQFANMFTDIGKNLMDSTIKGQLQRGLGALGNVFGVKLGGGKPDGSTEQNALWVRFGGLPLVGQGLDQKLAGGPATIARSLLGGSGAEGADSGRSYGGGSGESSAGGGLFDSIGHLFGRKAAPSAPGVALPTFPRATGANELQDLSAGPSSQPFPQPTPSSSQPALWAQAARPEDNTPNGIVTIPTTSSLQSIPSQLRAAALGGVPNELRDLSASVPAQPSSLQPSPSSLQSIPTLLRAAPSGSASELPGTGGSTSSLPSLPQPSPSSPQPASQPSSLQSIPTLLRTIPSGISSGAGGNELQDLAASFSPQPSSPQPSPSSPEPAAPQPSPSSPQPPTTWSLQSIPSMLRQGAAGAVLGASLLGGPMRAAAAPATAIPAASSTVFSGAPAGSSTVLPATPPIWSQATAAIPATPAMPAATVVPIGNPPDGQPKDVTQITRNPPTLTDKILGAGVDIAGKIGSSLLGGAITGGGSGSAASSSGASEAWAQAAQPDDNTPDGIVTVPYFAVGGQFKGKVSGPGTGTSDSINAKLSHGEYVTKASSTKKYFPLLEQINNDTLKFALGGLVGYDGGGLVSPSMAYMPGDRGTGMMSSASAQIASAGASSTASSGGDTHTWNIDARGNPDPAQTIAQTQRAMQKAAPQIAALAIHGMKDQQLRRASSAK